VKQVSETRHFLFRHFKHLERKKPLLSCNPMPPDFMPTSLLHGPKEIGCGNLAALPTRQEWSVLRLWAKVFSYAGQWKQVEKVFLQFGRKNIVTVYSECVKKMLSSPMSSSEVQERLSRSCSLSFYSKKLFFQC